MHIMFIPSWYSNPRNKVHGSFFKEQAIALQNEGVKITVAYNEIWPITMIGKIHEKVGLTQSVESGLVTFRYKNYNFLPKNPLMFKIFNKRMDKLYSEIIKDRGSIDIIHAQSSFWAGISARYISKKYNIPLVITEHSSVNYGNIIKKSYLPEIIRSYKEADRLIAVGSGLKKELEYLVGRNDIKVIPNMIGLKKENYQEDNSDSEFKFFSLAFLEGKKGMQNLLKAFKEAFPKKDVKLIIGGEGSQKDDLIQLAKSLNIDEKVSFTGALSREEVSKFMNSCDAFVLASEYETFGVVYIEALYHGKPVIGCYNGGAEDIINDENGYIVNKSDLNELVKSLKNMRKNIHKFSKENIIKQTNEKYNSKKIANQIISVYEELMKGL